MELNTLAPTGQQQPADLVDLVLRHSEHADQLRGNFYPSEENTHARRETLSYRGVHMVEAFVIHKMTNLLAGRSKPFYVVIE